MEWEKLLTKKFDNTQKLLSACADDTCLIESICNAIKSMETSLKNSGKLIFMGNGGSAADAQHIAAEYVSKFKINRKPLPAIALTVDSSILTSIGNDFSFNQIFSKQVEALGKKDDVLIGSSTSGNSENVINAFMMARELRITTIGLCGAAGWKNFNPDITISVPSVLTEEIQEVHLVIGHFIVGVIENSFFGNNND